VINLTFSGVGIDDTAVWYGGFNDGSASAVSLTDNVPVPVTPNSTTISYSFTTVVGKQVSYQDFNQFRLFTLKNNMLLARATIPNSPVKAPVLPGPTQSASPTASTPTQTSSQAKNTKPTNPSQPNINPASRYSLDPRLVILLSSLFMY